MSISSSEGSPMLLDLTAKYQKLAAEYAKVRVNVAVLKKAVLDEQARSTDLKETIKTKEQTLRKNDQELDSLIFRNQQLTKRVVFLQEELDKSQDVGKQGRHKQETGVTSEESKLFQEELQTRIIENAKLLSQLDEKEQELERERRQWQKSKAMYESQIMEAQNSLSSIQLARNKPEKEAVKLADGHETLSWIIIQSLPFSSLLKPLQCFVASEIGEALPDLENVFKATNEEFILSSLHEYLSQLALLISRIEKRNGMVCDFLVMLKKLAGEIVGCFDNTVPFQLSTISGVIEHLNFIAIKYKTPGTDDRVLNGLKEIQSGCECFQRALKQFLTSNQCQFNRLYCEEKVEYLEKKVSNLSQHTNGPTIDAAVATSESKSRTIRNEFGDGTIFEEPVWVDKCVRDHIQVMTSSLTADRQLAESKVTSLVKECEAMKIRLLHFSEESHRKDQDLSHLQEELSVTSRNYEEQLSSMSEHMANMNDKLAAQEATIEELSFELKNKKDGKKGRTK